MSFWDTSAIVAVLVEEPDSRSLIDRLRSEDRPVVWWATDVECESAVARQERGGDMTGVAADHARRDLDRLEGMWAEVEPTSTLRRSARDLVRRYPLSAADAMQLAAALAAADGEPGDLPFVCLDQRLRVAADAEGFPVVP